jgi:hypothetical protein
MEKIKQFFTQTIQSEKGKDVLIVIIVVLVGLGSFELGRLSKDNGSEGVKIDYPSQNNVEEANVVSAVPDVGILQSRSPTSGTIPTSTTNSSSGKNFFASSKGKKYYTTSCSAGKTIKQENRVYFTTGEEAEAAGYTLSSACD